MDEMKKSEWTCPECGTTVDTSSMGFLAELSCPQCGKAGHANSTLANFRLDNILGIGGMSVVMRAYDPTLGRPLAIKLLNETYRTQEDRIRKFESECSLMAKVRHENVVSVYSAGWDKGQFYIAMELVDGENLELIIDRRKFLLPNQAVEIIRQVALGLQAAHEAGLLHRDVKPGNVIITKGNQAKVLDFGLSMESHESEEDSEEVIWATPFYVPPETLRREKEDVRSDIYALGMTLRNLLTGVDTMPEEFNSVSSLLALKEKFPRMRSAYPHLDPDLCDFVDHMTAFKPADRPADYHEVLTELAELQEHLTKAGQRRATRLWLQEKKREIMILAGSALLGMVLATTVVCSTTVQEVQKYLTAPNDRTAPDWQDAAKAESLIAASQWQAAASIYQKLAEKTQDSGAGARAGMMAAMCKVLQGSSLQDADALLERASRHYAAAEKVAYTAPGGWQETLAALELAKAEAPVDIAKLQDIRQPLLRVATTAVAAARAMEEGFTQEAQQLAKAAADDAENGSGAFAELVAPLKSYELQLAHDAVPKNRERVLRLLGSGMLDQAQDAMKSLSALKLSSAEEAELQVQQELCTLAKAVFTAFRKHGEDPVKAMESPQLFRNAASNVEQDATFANEMHCLALMLRGEYAKAFSMDPYKDNTESNKPFAVLMRHWKQQLNAK